MALGLNRINLEGDITFRLKVGGGIIDQELAERVAAAIAEAIEKNNARIEEQLRAAGVAV